MASVTDVGRQRIKKHLFHLRAYLTFQVTNQVKVVKGLYTEVRNVQHIARGRVSRVFVLIDRECFE